MSIIALQVQVISRTFWEDHLRTHPGEGRYRDLSQWDDDDFVLLLKIMFKFLYRPLCPYS